MLSLGIAGRILDKRVANHKTVTGVNKLVNCSITFSRNLNLLIEDDLSTFFQELARASYPLPVTTEDELNKLVHFGREFFPDSAFEISAGMTPIEERL